MANEKDQKAPESKAPEEPKVEQKTDEVATTAVSGPTAAGRLQPGEKAEGLSTRPPRGVGEPASDAIADDEHLAEAQLAVHEQVKTESEQGFRGVQVDSTPNEHYTVAGVTAGKPVPETAVNTPRGR